MQCLKICLHKFITPGKSVDFTVIYVKELNRREVEISNEKCTHSSRMGLFQISHADTSLDS